MCQPVTAIGRSRWLGKCIVIHLESRAFANDFCYGTEIKRFFANAFDRCSDGKLFDICCLESFIGNLFHSVTYYNLVNFAVYKSKRLNDFHIITNNYFSETSLIIKSVGLDASYFIIVPSIVFDSGRYD